MQPEEYSCTAGQDTLRGVKGTEIFVTLRYKGKERAAIMRIKVDTHLTQELDYSSSSVPFLYILA